MLYAYFHHRSQNSDFHQILLNRAVHQNSFDLKKNIIINLVRYAILLSNFRYDNLSYIRYFIYLIKSVLISNFMIRFLRLILDLDPQIFDFENYLGTS